jgi:hypothetical protein
MKTMLSVFCVLFSFITKSQIISIDSIISMQSLRQTVSALAHDSMKGRFTAMPETKTAAGFIAARFEMAGLKTVAGNEGYFSFYPLKYKYKNEITRVEAINVIGVLQGNVNTDTMVIFCAHYDHLGVNQNAQPGDKDSVFNGANDNASGVAALIELAKYYSAIQINRYTLVFIAFSGEELGLHGSAYTASQVDQSLVHAVINMDMLGRPINSYTNKCMVIAEKPGTVIKELNAQLFPKKSFFIPDQYPEEFLFTRSDHYSFTEVKNRVFFTGSSPRDKYYHTLHDEYSTIDFGFLLAATKNIALGCKIFLK